MDECIERKALLEALENADPDVYEDYGDGTVDWGFGRKNIQDMINGIPAADVAPVVRCRDCKHLRPEVDAYTQETVGYWCAELDIGSVDVDGFCNRGERKETDHE